MSNELERVYKEGIVDSFRALSRHLKSDYQIDGNLQWVWPVSGLEHTVSEPGNPQIHNRTARRWNPKFFKIKVTLRLTVSQSACLGVEPKCGTFDQIFFQSYSLVLFGAPSLTRGRVCHVSVFVIEVYRTKFFCWYIHIQVRQANFLFYMNILI
jgi:hypothetical protein